MRISTVLALTVPLLTLSACYDYGYGGGPGYAYNAGVSYPYAGYYDGFYGPIHDGYWGGDGFFYYRRGGGERAFIRGDRNHFAREARNDGRFQQFRGEFRPERGMRTPAFRGGDNRGGNDRGGHDRGGHGHDRH